MRLHRFFVHESLAGKAAGEKIEIKSPDLIKQFKNVLRLGAGDAVIVFDDEGFEATAVIEEMRNEGVRLMITKIEKTDTEIKRRVTLYASILKRENFELVVQKATEIGIAAIVPVISARTIKTGLNHERLRKIIIEAAEQSGRRSIPDLKEAISFADALAANHEMKILFEGEGTPLLDGELKNKNDIAILIGPEGGWTEQEVALAKENNFLIRTMGSLTFRAETAAIVASYLAVGK